MTRAAKMLFITRLALVKVPTLTSFGIIQNILISAVVIKKINQRRFKKSIWGWISFLNFMAVDSVFFYIY